MPPFAAPLRRFALVALLCAGSLAGCDEAKVVVTGPAIETEDSNYQEGRRFVGEGKYPEALNAFTKVILSRRDAPESHLEAGNLCLTQIKDPLMALFHFRMFLKLSPDSPQAGVVKQRIRACEKEFLKTLPFRPVEGNSDDRVVDLMEKLKIERSQNDELKQKLNEALNNIAKAAPASRAVPAEDLVADTTPAPAPTPAPALTPVRLTTPETAPVSTGAKKTYVIAKGDSLLAISRKVYGKQINRVNDIKRANPGLDERKLKVGTTIVIPD